MKIPWLNREFAGLRGGLFAVGVFLAEIVWRVAEVFFPDFVNVSPKIRR